VQNIDSEKCRGAESAVKMKNFPHYENRRNYLSLTKSLTKYVKIIKQIMLPCDENRQGLDD
jgi:hypothetical protein